MPTVSRVQSAADSLTESEVIRIPDRTSSAMRQIHVSFSLMRLGIGGRLVGAAGLAALVWTLTLAVTG